MSKFLVTINPAISKEILEDAIRSYSLFLHCEIEEVVEAAQQSVQRTDCFACGGDGIIYADSVAANCPNCNPAISR